MINKKINDIALTGIGIALFVVMSICLQVPVFENYYLCLGYIVMIVYIYLFGITKGIIIGVLGTFLYCIIINGIRGLPGWAIGNVFVALIISLAFHLGKKLSNKILKYTVYIMGIILGCCLGILVIKSIVEYFIYAQPIILRMTNNIYAFIADVVVLIAGVPICEKLEKVMNSLTKYSTNS